jgi:phosphoribosylformylglycinamidine (FGAM) synthase PurS component
VRCGRRTQVAGLSRRQAERLAEKVLANETVHEWRID